MRRRARWQLVALLPFALLGASEPTTRPGRGPLEESEVVLLLERGVTTARLRTLVQKHGVAFALTSQNRDRLRLVGADRTLLAAVEAAPRPTATSPTPVAEVTTPALLPSETPTPAWHQGEFDLPMVLIRDGPGGRDLYVARYEVTNEEYLQFCEAAGHRKPDVPYWGTEATRRKFPVVNVTLWDAKGYCRWLSSRTHHRYRLPTEAEWEYAARGGLGARTYPWGNQDPRARSCFGRGGPCRRGQFGPNPLGLYDMAGSVYEWCDDRFEKGSKNQDRVIRGGSWHSKDAALLAVTHRERHDPDKARNDIGFRVVLDP